VLAPGTVEEKEVEPCREFIYTDGLVGGKQSMKGQKAMKGQKGIKRNAAPPGIKLAVMSDTRGNYFFHAGDLLKCAGVKSGVSSYFAKYKSTEKVKHSVKRCQQNGVKRCQPAVNMLTREGLDRFFGQQPSRKFEVWMRSVVLTELKIT